MCIMYIYTINGDMIPEIDMAWYQSDMILHEIDKIPITI